MIPFLYGMYAMLHGHWYSLAKDVPCWGLLYLPALPPFVALINHAWYVPAH